MDHLFTQMEVKAVRATQRIIVGFAAGIGNTDRVSDRIMPGAFAKTLASKAPSDVAVFIGHKTDSLPVGIPMVIRETPQGLYTETLVKPGPAGDDLLATAEFLKAHGKALAMSIGYRVHPGGASFERGTDGKMLRKLTSVELLEYSYAAEQSAANGEALVVDVKAGSDDDAEAAAAAESAATLETKMDETPITWDAAYLASLPDSAFLRVDPGEQEDGRTVPASKRHWAYRDAEGKIAVERLVAVLPELDGAPGLQGRVQWLLAQPESKLAAAAEAAEWQSGAVPALYAEFYAGLAEVETAADQQKAMRFLGQDVHDGQYLAPEACARLRERLARIEAKVATAELLNAGKANVGLISHYETRVRLWDVAS